MELPIVVGIDIGTTKICTLVGRVEGETSLRVLGVGIEPSQGIRKGNIVDITSASQAIARSVEKAQRSSGLEITSALVSLAGAHVSSMNSKGVVGIAGRVITQDDIDRALDNAQAVAIPHNREIIHVIQRSFTVDGQDGIRMPIGMHGYRLEVEAHIITASAATVENLRKCVQAAGIQVTQFVLNPLASAEVVMNDTERQMGCIVCDIGGGTTDMAIYIDGDIWHTMVLALGGNHVTSDVAHGLGMPLTQAEEIKKEYGQASEADVAEDDSFTVKTFGEEEPVEVSRRHLAMIIEARVEEIFEMVMEEIRRSGYDGLLPAGVILTGGTSSLRGIRRTAARVMNMPARVAKPENLIGLVDQLQSPAYATSVGLLYWAMLMNEAIPSRSGRARDKAEPKTDFQAWFKEFLRSLFP